MPCHHLIRARSRYMHKHSYSHFTDDFYNLTGCCTLHCLEDSDDEYSCSYGGPCFPTRGRSRDCTPNWMNDHTRGLQNSPNRVLRDKYQKSTDTRGLNRQYRSRSRSTTALTDVEYHSSYPCSDENNGRYTIPVTDKVPRPHQGHCCIHGYGHVGPCPFCQSSSSSSRRAKLPPSLSRSRGKNIHSYYTTDDEDEDVSDLLEAFKIAADEEAARQMAEDDKKATRKKVQSEMFKLKGGIEQRYPLSRSRPFKRRDSESGSTSDCGRRQSAPRSAAEILQEIEHLKAERAQLRAAAKTVVQAETQLSEDFSDDGDNEDDKDDDDEIVVPKRKGLLKGVKNDAAGKKRAQRPPKGILLNQTRTQNTERDRFYRLSCR